jgi:NAD(P)-dependent dehydrogenase (short-subunit alcohol dehydrogenase family)
MLTRRYDGVQAYCQSKLALVMMTFDLAEELAGTGVTANCLHPATYMPTKMVLAARRTGATIIGSHETVRCGSWNRKACRWYSCSRSAVGSAFASPRRSPLRSIRIEIVPLVAQ